MSTEIARRSSNGGVTVPTDPIRLGEVLAASGFFQDSRGAAQAAVKVMAGQELGFGPVASMTGVYIVKGRVTLSANLMAAAIKRHPSYTYRVREHTTENCVIDFVEHGEVIGTSEFSMDDAKVAGLASGENYKKFAKNMLFARALSNGAKWHCPDVFGGGPVYTPDELGAEIDGETGNVVNAEAIEPAAIEPEPELLSEESVTEVLAAIKRAAKGSEWVRSQLVAVGAQDVPDGPLTKGTIQHLTAEQAVELVMACDAAAEKAEAK